MSNKYGDSELWQDSFLDFMKVVEMGASKYAANGWMDPDGANTSKKDQFASMNRHLAKWFAGNPIDEESGLHHLLHVMTRCAFEYTRHQLGIKHPDDTPPNKGLCAPSLWSRPGE